MDTGDGNDGPEAKRKKTYSRKDIIDKLAECENEALVDTLFLEE